jgi:hypothetical protein
LTLAKSGHTVTFFSCGRETDAGPGRGRPLDEGVQILKAGPGLEVEMKLGLKPPELKAAIGDYDALAVGSATMVTPG